MIEGIADGLAGLARLAGGALADDPARRRATAVGGYTSVAVLSGLISAATSLWHVAVLRAVAWTARGLRVPSRNALLADATPREAYGRAFRFERMMDMYVVDRVNSGAIQVSVTCIHRGGAGDAERRTNWLPCHRPRRGGDQRLDALRSAQRAQERGLVTRTVTEGPPLSVTYALTNAGRALLPAPEKISRWAEEHPPL